MQTHKASYHMNLASVKSAPFPTSKPTHRKSCIFAPVEPKDLITEMLKEPSNLSVLSLEEACPRLPSILVVDFDFARSRFIAVLQRDSPRDCPRVFQLQRSIQRNGIDARHSVAWMHQPIGDGSIVGQKENTGCIAIEASDRIDPFADIDKIEHGPSPPFVACGRDDIFRLVQKDVYKPLGVGYEPIIDHDAIRRLHLETELTDDRSVDLDPSFEDHLVGSTPGGNAGIGDGLVETTRTDVFDVE